MKKTSILIVLVLLVVCLLAPILVGCNKGGNQLSRKTDDKLVVYNWEDYIDPDTLKDFEAYYQEKTGRSIGITYTTFDTNETMMTKVLKGDANVDLIAPSEYSIEKLMRAGTLQNISTIKADLQPKLAELGLTLDNWDNCEPEIMEKINEIFVDIPVGNGKKANMSDYIMPYMWGTLGILYNTKYVTEQELEEYGWGILWNKGKNPVIENKILMKDSIRDSYVAAVCYLKECGQLPDVASSLGAKYDDLPIEKLINCTDQTLLDAAEVALIAQREHISGYEVDFGKDDMINEIVYLDLAWSGDALWAIEEGGYDEETDTYQLGYYVPEIGSNIWYDGWVVPNTVQNKLASVMFIDFMAQPINAIRNSIYIGYTSAVAMDKMQNDADACALIVENEYDLEEYFGDIGRYPNISDKLGVMQDFGSANESA
ncbi:MAG: extracellular solute-binding protein, partial [Clostridia bacterium]